MRFTLSSTEPSGARFLYYGDPFGMPEAVPLAKRMMAHGLLVRSFEEDQSVRQVSQSRIEELGEGVSGAENEAASLEASAESFH